MEFPTIPLAGVVGSPISHSKSPMLHGYWLRKYGLPGFYVPLDVKTSDFREVLRMLPQMGFVGVNVTIPHKEAALQVADVVADRASLIGAANTLSFRPDGTIHADNTDGYGFIENLRAGAPKWDPKITPAAVLGGGGAARAVVASLLEAGVPEILLSNRTRVRAEKLQYDFGQRVKVVDWVQAGNMLESVDLVVNTTSLGMMGKPRMRVPFDGLRQTTVVSDLVYTPLQTELLRAAKAHGCVTVDGLGMLLHQGVPGFERWFGHRPEVDAGLRDMLLA
ncbi:MAG: shikimate dehydrogenase [Pseudomonadota bacterium]